MRIRLAIPDELDDRDRKDALDAALESVTRTVTGMVRSGAVPPAAGEIKAKRVHWKPEPPGDEHFDLPSTVMARGHGDCDDLAPWHAGSLRAGGVDPGARAIVRKSGPKRWHAIVQRSDGSIEDPSAHAGMHSVSGGACHGAGEPIQRPMSEEGKLCVAICPQRDRRHPLVWFARCDVPDKLEPWDYSTMAAHPDPSRALLHAVKTARAVAGDAMDGEDFLRLGALNDLVLGADPDEVAEALAEIVGDDVVGEILGDAVHSVGFFGGLLKGLKQVTAAPFKIPGVSQLARMGLPIAGTIFGGPAGAMAGGMLGKFIPGGRPLPGMLGKAMNLAQAAQGMIPGMGMPGIPGLPGMLPGMASAVPGLGPLAAAGGFPDLAHLASQIPGASHGLERGILTRPWGSLGPGVMRF
jgi:hypothetical protein